MDLIITDSKKKLAAEARILLLHSPLNMFATLRQRIDYNTRSLNLMIVRRLKEEGMAISLLEEKLKDLSPLSVLKRGYSITRKLPDKKILRDVSRVEKGDRVDVILSEGGLECRIEKIAPGGNIGGSRRKDTVSSRQ